MYIPSIISCKTLTGICERSKVSQVAQEMRGTQPITLVTTGNSVTTQPSVSTAST